MQELRYVIPEIPPSNNQYIGRNMRFEYQNAKKAWAEKIFYLCRPRPAQPFKKALVCISYYFKDKRRRDPDNYSGKFILDGLVRSGVIEDDSFSQITLQLKGYYDKNNPRTVIYIKELQNNV